jgi:putative transcriptional regulator
MKALSPGLLLAMPQLGDPNFHRSVVLMIEHGEGGSMGLVINRGAPLTLGELAKGQSMKISPERSLQPVFVGGPVEPHRGFILHDDVTLDALAPLLENPVPRVRFCLGYAGWGPRQLEQEMKQGSWLFAEAAAGPILDGNPGQLWDETLRGMGVDPAMLMVGKGLH